MRVVRGAVPIRAPFVDIVADVVQAESIRGVLRDALGARLPARGSRGGSWRHYIKISRVAARSSIPPEFEYADYGFRVARS